MENKTVKPLLFGLLIAAGCASAEESILDGVTLSPMLGYYNYDSDRGVDDEKLYSIGLGYELNDKWGLEFVYLKADTETKRSNVDVDLDQIRLDAIYNLNRNNNIQPYLAAGIGENEFDSRFGSDDETIINGGGGLKYFVTPKLSLRGDVRLINSLDEEKTDIAFSLGLQYTFGEKQSSVNATPAAVVAAEPLVTAVAVDSDADGVADDIDQCMDTESGAKVDSNGCYIIVKEGHSIELEVNFANNSSVVTADNFAEITKVAEFMNDYPQTSVVIEGHTDDTGAADYNQLLSKKRAQAVAAILIERNNINASRVSAKGFGESSPLYDSSVQNYRAKNRRVVAVINVTTETRQKQ
jgi:OOP family OmpA-OmpF porin